MTAIEQRSALTKGQSDFLDKLHVAARLLATPHLSRAAVMERLLELYPDMAEKEARRWVARAREYIAMGVPEDQGAVRNDYIAKLQALIASCSEHLITDKVEVTVVRALDEKPGAPATPRAEGDEEDIELGRVKSAKRKVTPRTFNPAVAQVMLKALRHLAEVNGAAPRAGGGPRQVVFNNTKNTLNMPGARGTADLSDEDILRLAFGENVKLLPGSGAEGHAGAGVPPPPGGVPEGDRHAGD